MTPPAPISLATAREARLLFAECLNSLHVTSAEVASWFGLEKTRTRRWLAGSKQRRPLPPDDLQRIQALATYVSSLPRDVRQRLGSRRYLRAAHWAPAEQLARPEIRPAQIFSSAAALEARIAQGEDEQFELKSCWTFPGRRPRLRTAHESSPLPPDQIRSWAAEIGAGFASGRGGILVFGVDDDHRPSGHGYGPQLREFVAEGLAWCDPVPEAEYQELTLGERARPVMIIRVQAAGTSVLIGGTLRVLRRGSSIFRTVVWHQDAAAAMRSFCPTPVAAESSVLVAALPAPHPRVPPIAA